MHEGLRNEGADSQASLEWTGIKGQGHLSWESKGLRREPGKKSAPHRGGFRGHGVEARKQTANLGRHKGDSMEATRQDPMFHFKTILLF